MTRSIKKKLPKKVKKKLRDDYINLKKNTNRKLLIFISNFRIKDIT